MIYEYLINSSEAEAWNRVLPATRSVFGSLQYARLCEKFKGISARMFVVEDGVGSVAYPFFLRDVRQLAFVPDDMSPHYDIASPEFTGPLMSGRPERAAVEFRERFERACHLLGVVAEFAHLHCWADTSSLLLPDAVQLNREIVWVDLTVPYETLWRDHFEHSCRKNIKRSEKEGVRVFEADSNKDIREFHRIYFQTMDRRSAEKGYYFPSEYFLQIRESMPDNSLFLLAEHNGEIVAATLYLYDDVDVYSYLGGADDRFQQIRPTNAIIRHAITWAQSAGKKRLVLGGGYQPNDGIFRFKATFSSLRAQFRTYRRVHLASVYDQLTQCWLRESRKSHSPHFFPAYRASLEMN